MNSTVKSKIRALAFKNYYPIVEYPGPDFLKDTSKIRNLIFAILAVTIIALGCLKGTMISQSFVIVGYSQFKRKLTAILCADAAGCSRLMGEDEAATVRTLTSHRNIVSTLIRQHNGAVIDSPGDSLLAEFVSVVDAVQFAVAV